MQDHDGDGESGMLMIGLVVSIVSNNSVSYGVHVMMAVIPYLLSTVYSFTDAFFFSLIFHLAYIGLSLTMALASTFFR